MPGSHANLDIKKLQQAMDAKGIPFTRRIHLLAPMNRDIITSK